MEYKICAIANISKVMDWFIVDTMRFLSINGFTVTLISDMDDDFIERNKDFCRLIPIPMKRGFDPIGTIRAIYTMTRLFKKEKFDIIQYATPNASLSASVAAFFAGAPRRLYTQWGIRYVGFSNVKRFFYKSIEKLICMLSTHIEPDSFGNLNFSRAEGLYKEHKSKVVWNGSAAGVNFEKFDISRKALWRIEVRSECSVNDDSVMFGFVGRLDRDKGINELLEAFRIVLDDYPDAYLIIIGRADKVDTLDPDLYQWSRTSPNVIYIGEVNNVEKYISAMDVFVLPSYREGFGTVVIEAEAMAVPVIVTDIPGPTEAMINGETGLVVKKADVYTLKEAMICLIQDNNKRREMGNKGLNHVKDNYNAHKLREYILQDRKGLIEMKEGERRK